MAIAAAQRLGRVRHGPPTSVVVRALGPLVRRPLDPTFDQSLEALHNDVCGTSSRWVCSSSFLVSPRNPIKCRCRRAGGDVPARGQPLKASVPVRLHAGRIRGARVQPGTRAFVAKRARTASCPSREHSSAVARPGGSIRGDPGIRGDADGPHVAGRFRSAECPDAVCRDDRKVA